MAKLSVTVDTEAETIEAFVNGEKLENVIEVRVSNYNKPFFDVYTSEEQEDNLRKIVHFMASEEALQVKKMLASVFGKK